MSTVMVAAVNTMSTVGIRDEKSSLEDDVKRPKRKISLSKCSVCGSEEAKYRCPACLKHSCSLPCVKNHKDVSGCSGVRDKTAFVALSQFDEMNLLNDYRFLEDTGRLADGATRDTLVRTPRVTVKAKKLAANARKMNITLRFLPVTFTKSRENSTIFLAKERRFLWHLKLIFPQSSTEFSERRVPDEKALKQILTPYIHPTESDPVRRQKLKMYAQATFDQVKVFMKAEGRKANSVRYHELDLGKSLRDNLSYKTLIEYPVLHVVLRDHFQDYQLKAAVEPASARNGFATEREDVDQGAMAATRVPPSPLGSLGGASGGPGTQEITHGVRPPKEKRAKREAGGEEDMEEGEIMDSSEEEEEEEEESHEKNTKEETLVHKSCTGVNNDKGHADVLSDVKVTKDEAAGSAGDYGNLKLCNSTRDPCIDEHLGGSADASGTDDVSTTEEDPLKPLSGPGPVHISHGRDENRSTNAAKFCV
ncbi:box C/D snoRNA protein 1 [Polymixia lowei]